MDDQRAASVEADADEPKPNQVAAGTRPRHLRPGSGTWLAWIPSRLGRDRVVTNGLSSKDPSGTDRSDRRSELAGFRRAGVLVLGVQFIAMVVYSVFEFSRWSLTRDYSFYARSLSLLAHLHFPHWFFTSNAELSFTLLAPTYWLWPHGPVLLIEQDLAVVIAEVAGFLWMCDIVAARKNGSATMARLVAGAGLIALLANPWIWWTIAFDFHFEVFGAMFAILFARDLYNGRRRAWVWAILTLLSGDVAATYLAAVAFGGLIRARRWVWALASAGVAIGWVGILHAIGAMQGAEGSILAVAEQPNGQGHAPSVAALGQLVLALFRHPSQLGSLLWSERNADWANLGAPGVIGVLWPFALFVPLVVIVENSVFGSNFSRPSFQSIPIYLFLPVGLVVVLLWLLQRHRWLAVAAGVLAVADVLAWGVIWLPRTPNEWIRVPAVAAAQLDRFAGRVPDGAEVIVSQGVEGRFAQTQEIVGISTAERFIPLLNSRAWVVVTPNLGTETAPAAVENELVAELAAMPNARPVVVGNGVWGYEVHRVTGERYLILPEHIVPSLPAWLFRTTTGRIVTRGPESSWRMAGNGKKGYLAWGDYWTEPTGPAVATAVVSGRGPVSVEVWDVTTDTLLARRLSKLTGERVEVKMPFSVPVPSQTSMTFDGWGPFGGVALPNSADQLEVRVYTPGSAARIDTYSLGMDSRPA